jgi:hypothetical protein
MTVEKLEQAKGLEQAIKDVEDHIRRVKEMEKENSRALRLHNNNGYGVNLKGNYLFMTLNDFIEVYLQKADKKLEELKTELENL